MPGNSPTDAAPQLLLASTSPRRAALLQQAGIAFLLIAPGPEYPAGGSDADPRESGAPADLALLRARRKALAAAVGDSPLPVLGVDTVVDLDGSELGKPRDRADAEQMHRRLAGRSHLVHTAHVLWLPQRSALHSEVCSAQVHCQPTDEAKLHAYLDSGAWHGKAGGYGIQDPQQDFLRPVAGSFDTIVGLHVAAVQRLLALLAKE